MQNFPQSELLILSLKSVSINKSFRAFYVMRILSPAKRFGKNLEMSFNTPGPIQKFGE